MQQLWSVQDEKGQKLDWDQPLPSTVGEAWLNLRNQLSAFNQIKIDRCVIVPGAVSVEIHCFSDASEKAFGACVYLRSIDAVGKVMNLKIYQLAASLSDNKSSIATITKSSISLNSFKAIASALFLSAGSADHSTTTAGKHQHYH
nr:uncharacterized protein LOC115261606 [Aedes albopictus]